MGAHGWVQGLGFASHGSGLHLGAANSGSSWMSQALNLYFMRLLLTDFKIILVQWDHPANGLETVFLSEMLFILIEHIHVCSIYSLSFVFVHYMYCPKSTDMNDNIEIIYMLKITLVKTLIHWTQKLLLVVEELNVGCFAPSPCRPKLHRPSIEVVSPQH